MKTLLAGAAALAILAAPAAADVKVGMITTAGSHLGDDIRDGFNLAVKMSGRDDVEVLVRDDQQKPDIAKSLSDELIQKDKVDVLTGIIWSNLALTVVPPAVRQGVFYLSPNAGPSELAGELCHENYFNVSWQNDNFSEAMGAWFKEQGMKKPFLMAPNYPAGTDMMNGFKSQFEGDLGGELYTQLGQTDYAAEIAQIRASDAESVYFFLPGGMGIAFMKQWGGSGVDKPVFGPAFSFDEVIVDAVGDASLGVMNTAHWGWDLDNEANKKFVAAFQEEYGRLPTLYASQGYDTALLLLSAMEKADIADKDAFRAALKEADFESTRGDFEFGPNHHPIQTIYMREVVKGEDGTPTNHIVGVAVERMQDAHYSKCNM